MLLCAGSAHAAVLNDGAGGATCLHYSIEGLLGWQHRGGDWVDATLRAQGPAPFAQARLPLQATREEVTLSLDALGQAWQRGDVEPGTLMLRPVPNGSTGIVDFASREMPGAKDAPSLVAVWSDGKIETTGPIADTFLNCTSLRSLGNQPIFKVSPDDVGLLVFAWKPAPGRTLRSLTLRLTKVMQYGRDATVGAYGVRLPRSTLARQPSLAEGEPRDAGLARTADVLFAEDFDRGTRWQEFMTYPGTQPSLSVIDRDPAGKFEPIAGRALRVVVRRGSTMALNHHVHFAKLPGGEPDEAYFRYHLRLGDNWDPVVSGGKLPGFSGTYNRAGWGNRRADGTNGWSARGAFFGVSNPPLSPERYIGSTPVTMDEDLGDNWGWNLGPTGRLHKNRWYAIEQYIKLNTPGKADGILRTWVDGEVAMSRETIRFRSTPALKVESVWFNVYHGGVDPTDRDLTLYIDNVVVARKYIGPGRFAQ